MLFSLLSALSLLLSLLPTSAHPSHERRQELAKVVTKCNKANHVALTFDDGPFKFLNNISDTLTAAGAKGTFFFNGNNYGCIYSAENVKRVKYAYQKGHQIASHTWAHKDLATLDRTAMNREFWLLELALRRIIGVKPAFMRPPYGSYNNLVLEVAKERGQKVAMWDFDSRDSLGATPAQSKQLYTDIANKRPTSIVALNHEVYQSTAYEVLPHAIKVLQAKGYKLVTLAECLGQFPYNFIREPEVGTWTC